MKVIPFLFFYFLAISVAFGQIPKDSSEANAQVKLALQLQQQAEFGQSNKLLLATADFYKQEKLWEGYINSCNQMARNYWKMHELDSSLAISTSVLALPQLEQNSLLQAEAFSNTGVVYDLRSEYDIALKYFHKCLDIRKAKLGEDHFETGKIYYNIGACYSLQRKMNTAIEYYENALNNFKKNLGEEHPFLITVYEGMRDPYSDLGRSQEAIDQLKKALKIAEKIYPPGHNELAGIIHSIGLTYLDIPGANDQAIKYVESSYKMQAKNYGDKHPEMVRICTNMGTTYKKLKKFELAQDYFIKALNISKEVFGSKHIRNYYVYTGLGDVAEENKQDSLALAYHHAAVLALLPTAADDTPIEQMPNFEKDPIISIPLLANAYSNKTFVMDKLIQKDTTSNYYKDLYKTHLKKIDELILRAKQDLHNLDDQIEILEQASRYTLKKVWFYRALDPNKKQQELLEEMVLDADKCKSILLKAALSTTDAFQFGGVPDSLRAKEVELKSAISKMEQQLYKANQQNNQDQVSELNNQLFKLKQEEESLNKKLEKEHVDYYNLKYKNNKLSIKDIQDQLLDEHTMIIEYLHTVGYIYVFMITKNKTDVEYIALDNGFQDRIKKFRIALSNFKYIQANPNEAHQVFCDNAYYFYELLLKKYVPSSIKNIIVMPDKELNRLPFEAFLTAIPKSQKTDYISLDYVLKKYNIRYAYSSELLLEFQQRKQKNPNNSHEILAFAASYAPSKITDELRSSLAPLPGAQKEVEAIQEQFKGEFYFGNQASETTFKSKDFSKFSIVHLAMHGLMDKKNPMSSSMVFTKDSTNTSTEDDYLCAYELTNMNITTNLVVLSACETGDGKHEAVEGIMSIGRSFMYAGVPSLIMTLWQVNDFSTSFIMQEFYHLLADGATKSEALRQAKLSYLEHVKSSKEIMAHPFFWAAFIQLGDDDNINIQTNRNPFVISYVVIGVIVLLGGLFAFRSIQKKKELMS